MPPKKKFSKEQIIDAAFHIAETEGLSGITIRKVAERLGSSIAPIYVNFKDTEELLREVVKKISALSQEILKEQHSGHPFFDMGAASLQFARVYPVLFRDLLMNPNQAFGSYDEEMTPILIEQMLQDPELSEFHEKELRDILLKMRVFQTGLSVMVAGGMLPDPWTEEERMLQLLMEMGSDVIAMARLRKEACREEERG